MFKKIVLSVLSLCLIMPATHSKAANVIDTSAFARQDNTTSAKPVFEITSDFDLVLENDKLALYLNEQHMSIRVLNKESGYIYSSNLDDYEAKGINSLWQSYFDSGVTIEYFDKNNLLKSNSLTSSDANVVTYQFENDRMIASVDFALQKISFDVIVSLKGDEVSSSIPFESISDENGLLASVVLFPGMGATQAKDNDGYFLMADGIGALVRFDQVYSNLSVPYASPYFGNDYGINEYSNSAYNQRDAASNNFAYYGVVLGINTDGFVNWVESGSHHATLQMYPAGLISDLYFITNRFDYRYAYLQPISDTETISSKMKDMFDYDAKETYKFASEKANYVGLTQLYKDFLVQTKEIKTVVNEKTAIPLQIRFVGTSLTAGVLNLKTFVYSTLNGVSTAYDYLASQGVESLHISLDSFNERFNSNTLDYVSSVSRGNDLKHLSETILTNNDQLDYVDNMQWLLKGRINVSKSARRTVSGRFMSYNEMFAGNKLEFFSPNQQYLHKTVTANLNSKQASLFSGVFVDSYIDSDFNGQMKSRENEASIHHDFMKQIAQNKSIQSGLASADNIGFADYTTNNVISHSLYPYFSDTVPLVSILTSGYTINYTRPLNFSSDLNVDLLKAIEYNLMPQYYMMTQPASTKLILENNSIGQFDNWKESILEQYTFANDALKYVYNAQIIDYQVIERGVNKVVYDNGYSIIVNYLDNSVVYDGQSIASNNYLVVKE